MTTLPPSPLIHITKAEAIKTGQAHHFADTVEALHCVQVKIISAQFHNNVNVMPANKPTVPGKQTYQSICRKSKTFSAAGNHLRVIMVAWPCQH